VKIQVFLSPLISAFLFIFIFGFVLGRKIDLIAGVPYIEFVFLPLSFLGIFYSLTLLPQTLQAITVLNPFFYFVDGMRFAMIGFSEGNLFLGALVILGLIVGIGFLVWHLFKISWRLRE
jgi:ABC-2 type transport system permease protein